MNRKLQIVALALVIVFGAGCATGGIRPAWIGTEETLKQVGSGSSATFEASSQTGGTFSTTGWEPQGRKLEYKYRKYGGGR